MTRFKLSSKLLLSCASIAALSFAVPAYAQEATPQADQAAGADAGEIIVTAQRRSENVMKVPVSVTVIGAKALTDSGISDLRSITKLAPSLQAGQDNQFSIRGIGTATFADTVESSVTQVIDDVVLGSRYFASIGFYDVERVEVLNGPQGLLFGKNASAGVVNITTTAPRLGEMGASFDVEGTSRYRDDDNGLGVRTRTTLNLPIGEKTALRLNASYAKQDSIVNIRRTTPVRGESDVGEYAFRAKLLTEPTDNLSIYVIADYAKFTGISGTFDFTYRELGAGSQYPAILAGAGVTPGPRNLRSVVDGEYYRDLETTGVQAKIAYTLGSGIEITNIAAFKKYNLDQSFDSDFTTSNYLNRNFAFSNYEQFSNELRVALPADNLLSGQFGAYYFRSTNDFGGQRGGNNGFPSFVSGGFPFCVGAPVTAGPPPACGVSNRFFLGQDYAGRNVNESIAAFGQFSYRVTESLKLTAGGRVTHDNVALTLLENINPYFVTLGVRNNLSVGREKNTNFSWKVGADWEATPTTLIYGFYGHGYKGPGFSNASPARGADLSVDPEISRGGEVGIKQALFDRKVNVSVSAFYTKFDNLQVQSFDSALQTAILQNAAKATTKGIDANIQARPFGGLTLSASATLLDAKYDSYPGRKCYPGQSGCSANGTFDVSGRRVPQSAKFTSVVSAEYEIPLSAATRLQIGGSYYHRSALLTDYAPGTVIPSWDTLDANVGFRGDTWNIALFCKNCSNEIRPVSIEVEAGDGINAGALTYVQRWSYDSVRTLGLRFGFNF